MIYFEDYFQTGSKHRKSSQPQGTGISYFPGFSAEIQTNHRKKLKMKRRRSSRALCLEQGAINGAEE